MPQRTAHGNHLTLVMKRMRQNMVKDKHRRAYSGVSIRKMKLRIGVELLIGQG